MKRIVCIMIGILLFGCATSPDQVGVSPLVAGQVAGFTYGVTENQLSLRKRKVIEDVYKIFSIVADGSDRIIAAGITVEKAFDNALDKQFPDPDDIIKKEVVKLVIRVYWKKANTKYAIAAKTIVQQLKIIRQMRIGIERGLRAANNLQRFEEEKTFMRQTVISEAK